MTGGDGAWKEGFDNNRNFFISFSLHAEMDENQYTNGIILCYKCVNNKKLLMPERQTDGQTKSFCQFIERTCFAIYTPVNKR